VSLGSPGGGVVSWSSSSVRSTAEIRSSDHGGGQWASPRSSITRNVRASSYQPTRAATKGSSTDE
jgi:hypothetical protein